MNMKERALWYASKGLYVFPCHEPVFDDSGNCVGCTCEEWYRKQPKHGPNYVCSSPGKCPRTKWSVRSTLLIGEIISWWTRWPAANIGMDCGKSGLLMLDADKYKDNYAGDDLKIDEETVTSITGGGGVHLWYSQPPDKVYGSSKKGVPDGIDIKGEGGYVVLPGSVHPSGRTYEFELGYGLDEHEIKPIPQVLRNILDKIPQLNIEPAVFSDVLNERPKLSDWRLPDHVIEFLYTGHESEDRSNADWAVIASLVERGATDDQILAFFEYFPIGIEGRFNQDGSDYLARSIGKARAYVNGNVQQMAGNQTASPPPPPNNPPPSNNGASAPSSQPPPINILFLNEAADHEGNAVCVWHLYRNQFRFCEAIGWLYYNGEYWDSQNAEAALDRAIVDTLIRRRVVAARARRDSIVKKTDASSYNLSGTKKLFASKVTVNIADFDADEELLNCKNGVVNLRTGQAEKHSPKQLFTYCVPVEYDPNADYVEWIELLSNLLTSQTMVDFIQLAAGYSATGYTREECLFYVHGPTRSGKGTFAETLLTLLPRPLGIQADFATFTAKRDGDTQNFDLAPLRPARFIAASESSKYDTLNEAKIKTATGGDWIRCAYKHRDHFEYRPQFKIWLMSNHPVSGDVDDAAFWGRLRIINFPNSFLGREDKRLKQRMKSPEVLRGVLAWLVEGAVRWFALPQGLPIPKEVSDEVERHRNELDYVQQWIDECCIVDSSGRAWTANSVLHRSYKNWCDDNGVNAKGVRHFGRALSAKNFAADRNTLANGQRARGFRGLTVI